MGGTGGGSDLLAWINPVKNIPAMFSKKTMFGLDPLNITGVDKNRDAFTAPGSKGLEESKTATANADAAARSASVADGSQLVGGDTNTTNTAGNLGRAALISTSPGGVLGMGDQGGRRKLLGNE